MSHLPPFSSIPLTSVKRLGGEIESTFSLWSLGYTTGFSPYNITILLALSSENLFRDAYLSTVLRVRSSLVEKKLHRLHLLCVINRFSKVLHILCPLPIKAWAVNSLGGTEMGCKNCTNAYNVPLNQFSCVLRYWKTRSLASYITECIFISFMKFLKSFCWARKVKCKKSDKSYKYPLSQK